MEQVRHEYSGAGSRCDGPVRGLPADASIAASLGGCAEFPDPYGFFFPLLAAYSSFGNSTQPGLLVGKYRRRVEAAEKLVGTPG